MTKIVTIFLISFPPCMFASFEGEKDDAEVD